MPPSEKRVMGDCLRTCGISATRAKPLAKAGPSDHSGGMSGMQDRGWWMQEARATVALAYPLVLTNLAQALIPSTDVVLLGWAGPQTLAAGALGVNLYNACMIFGVGVMIAASPMMARALGQRSHNVREVRRTVRQSLWAAVALVI